MDGKHELKLSDKDKKLIRILQDELPLTAEPYREIAKRVGMGQAEVVSRVKQWVDSGVIRRFGATVRHQRMGYTANCMVVWKIEGSADPAEFGKILAGFPEVTHCYRRATFEGWPYSLYTMIHGSSPEDIEGTLSRMKEATGLNECRELDSLKEWKKTSMKYFSEEEQQ